MCGILCTSFLSSWYFQQYPIMIWPAEHWTTLKSEASVRQTQAIQVQAATLYRFTQSAETIVCVFFLFWQELVSTCQSTTLLRRKAHALNADFPRSITCTDHCWRKPNTCKWVLWYFFVHILGIDCPCELKIDSTTFPSLEKLSLSDWQTLFCTWDKLQGFSSLTYALSIPWNTLYGNIYGMSRMKSNTGHSFISSKWGKLLLSPMEENRLLLLSFITFFVWEIILRWFLPLALMFIDIFVGSGHQVQNRGKTLAIRLDVFMKL